LFKASESEEALRYDNINYNNETYCKLGSYLGTMETSYRFNCNR